jgi:polynucleotide 5'-hydroxyl-kinase GRC3/NOL9
LNKISDATSAIDLPPGWEAAAATILNSDGVTLVLGGSDCGKSTFCRFILAVAHTAGKQMALIDGDLGQSHLGPPATLGLNIYPPCNPNSSGLFPDSLYFIGQTSPLGKFLELTVGLHRLAQVSRSRGCRRLIVNTSGFINGPAGVRLKMAKAETLAPTFCLGLQRDRELEPVLTALQHFCPHVLTLPVSSQARSKLFTQRRLYRQERFAGYLASASPQALDLDKIVWLGFPFGQGSTLSEAMQEQLGQLLGQEILHAENDGQTTRALIAGRLTGAEIASICQELALKALRLVDWALLELRLVGLLDADLLTLALGLLLPSDWRRRRIFIQTPLPHRLLNRVKFCRLGNLRLDLSGQELPLS